MELSDYSLFDPRLVEEPWEYFALLRREAPVYRDTQTGIVQVSTYRHILDAVRRPDVFSNRFGAAMAAQRAPRADLEEVMARGWPPVDTLLTADPPAQKRFRALVNKAFTPRRVDALRDRVESLAHELIDAFAALGRVELVGEFANPLPLTLIAEQLGVPRSDLPRFRTWSEGFLAQLSGMASPDAELDAAKRIVEFQHYFAERLEERRVEPRDDLLSALVHARVEGERPLDVAECLSILQQLLVAGHETTASAIAEGILLLLRNPDVLGRLREAPELLPGAVEEMLRLASPVASMWRVAVTNTELAGVAIPAGSFLMLRYASANRDESLFPDPDRFDPERANAAEHLAFGHGIHFCIGATLARREIEVAVRALLERLPDLRLVANAPPPAHRPSLLLRGLDALHLEFEPAVES